MYETGNNDHEFYGFGVNGGIMRYQADRTTTDHVFFAGVTGGASSNELMRIKGTGNVGIGVVAPLAKLHVEGSEFRLSNATSLWGLAPEGTSPTSQFSIIDRTNSVRRFILLENGNAFLGGTLGTSGANATLSAVGGNVGIATTAPSNTLDVNGTARVRTMNSIAANTFITPVYTDANGVMVKPTNNLLFGTIRNTVTVTAGSTATLLTGLADGAQYKIIVSATDACIYGTIAEFFVVSSSFNGNVAIKGIEGMFTGGSSAATKSVTFSESAKNVTGVTWAGKPTCADGGDSTALNYTITVPTSPVGSINITNNGNVARTYIISLVRLN